MPTWEILDSALSHLESPALIDRWYSAVFREQLEKELRRLFSWLDYSAGGVEAFPSKKVVRLAEMVLELRGVNAVEPCDIVREALILMELERDEDGRMPGRLLNNYYTLRLALEYGDCAEWSVIGLAKSIIFARNGG